MRAMLVRDIGEFELIGELAQIVRDAGAGAVEGAGDEAAEVDWGLRWPTPW